MKIDRNELSVGGPNGIQIRNGVPQSPEFEPPRQDLAVATAFVREHPRVVAGGLVFAAAAMLVGPAIVISALGLSWALYIVPVIIATSSLGLAAAVGRGVFASRPTSKALEQRILDLAMRSGGELTVSDTAHAIGIPLSEAEEGLMSMARAGHVDIDNDPHTGAVLYVFRDIRGRQLPAR